MRCSSSRPRITAGARWVVLCDTNGGTMPSEVEEIVGAVPKVVPGDKLGIHAHDDTGQAVANSLAAVRAGVRQIQGTLNGLGERCGNANLVTIIPTLLLKPTFADRFETGVTAEQLTELTRVSRAFDELLNRASDRQAPYVGASAFATKAGIHASALAKDPSTYEHVPPESVGNERNVMVSQQAGKSNLLTALQAPRHHARQGRSAPRKAAAHASRSARRAAIPMTGRKPRFVMLAREVLGTLPDFFDVESYRASVERRHNARGQQIDGHRGGGQDRHRRRAADVGRRGQRPGQRARPRAAQGPWQVSRPTSPISSWSTSRCVSSTAARARSPVCWSKAATARGERWTTIGVSANIIDASFEALYESITYKLVKTRGSAA